MKDGRNITEPDVLHATSAAVIGQDVVEALLKGKVPSARRSRSTAGGSRSSGRSRRRARRDSAAARHIVVIPISTFDRYFPQTRNSHDDTIHIATIPRSPELIHQAIEEGTALLRARRKVPFDAPNDFAIFTSEKMIAQMPGVTNAISGVMVFIAGIALLVGGVGVMNIMLVS